MHINHGRIKSLGDPEKTQLFPVGFINCQVQQLPYRTQQPGRNGTNIRAKDKTEERQHRVFIGSEV